MMPKPEIRALSEGELARFLRRGWVIAGLREDLTVHRLDYGSSGYYVFQGTLTGMWYVRRLEDGLHVPVGPESTNYRPDGARIACEDAVRKADPALYRKLCREGRESAGGRS